MLFQIEEGVPPHTRFSEDAGYDDFHKAFRAINKQWPNKNFPAFGPPRYTHVSFYILIEEKE